MTQIFAFRFVFIMVAILSATPGLSARNLFVSPTGDNSTGETWDTSFHTISSALEDAGDGDSVHVAAGAYIESVTIPVGVSLIGGHPPNLSGSATYNRNPRFYITIIGRTENYSAVRMWQSTVLDGFVVFGRIYQTYEGGPVYPTTITIRTCRIEYEHPDITYPAISSWMPCCHAVLIMEECFVKYSTQQPSPLMSISVDCRIVNTIFSYDLPLETLPILFAGGGSGPFRFAHCVFFDRGTGSRQNIYQSTVAERGSLTLRIYSSISNQPIRRLFLGTQFFNSMFSGADALDMSRGNKDVDPQFVDPDNDNFRLLPTSPAIDMENDYPWGVLPSSMGSVHHDFLGRPRVVDIPGVGGTGDYSVDIGAFEMQLEEYRLRSDFNWDGVVDSLDLLIFSQDWHQGTGP